MNVKMCISFQMSVFISSDKYPEVELLDYMIALFLTFWGKSVFSIVAVQIYIPQQCTWILFFSTSLPTLIIHCLFNNNRSNKCEVISHCGFFFFFFLTHTTTLLLRKEQMCVYVCYINECVSYPRNNTYRTRKIQYFHKCLAHLMSEKQLYEADDKKYLFLAYRGHQLNY